MGKKRGTVAWGDEAAAPVRGVVQVSEATTTTQPPGAGEEQRYLRVWGEKPGKEKRMFGLMSVDAILRVKRECDPLAAVRALVELAEGVNVRKWIEFPDSILVFLMIPGEVTSGSIYVLDRKSGVWYWIDFDDEHYGGYSQEEFERLLSEGKLLSLIERPGLLGSGLKWVVECGEVPLAT